MKSPPFSVLISVYAKEKSSLLDRALRSVMLEQTVKPAEVVLVEDGPLTQPLYDVIEKYRKLFPSLVSVRLPQNVGLALALNAGLAACSNEWVARMDSDDISLSTRFERQLAYLNRHPDVDVLGCSIAEFDQDETIVKSIKSCPKEVDSFIRLRCPVNHPTVFYKKTAVLEVGGYRVCPYMEDYFLWVNMFAAGMTVTSIEEPLYLFKMDMQAHKRRGGWTYVVSELKVQRQMLKTGIISIPRYCLNVAVRCVGRIIPLRLRRFIYRTFLRRNVAGYTLGVDIK